MRGAVVVCGARWLCVGRGGCVWGAVVVCGARWLCGRASDFRSRGPGFQTTCSLFETWVISFTPVCLCPSEETPEAIGPFYLVICRKKQKVTHREI